LKYKIIKVLDSGTFATVYELQADDNKRYPLKELKHLFNKERFKREIKILAELDHPNIVKIFRWNIGRDPI
jgi:serine/threonine protein kinase